MANLVSDALKYLSGRHGRLFDFWTNGHHIPEASIEEHCDMVYSLFLLGETAAISSLAVRAFLDYARTLALPGWHSPAAAGSSISVHNCAYLFGALNLLGTRFTDLYAPVLEGREFRLHDLVEKKTLRPRFPSKWSHHNWRVSHWLGGIPSILLSLESSVPDKLKSPGISAQVRVAVDGLMDPSTGLIRAYRSAALQRLFRLAYSLKHNPDLGDVGGVAHILWIDHVLGRRYIAVQQIRDAAAKLLLAHRPFMEQVPYCLDFDIVQALRTSSMQMDGASSQEIFRASELMEALADYFSNPAPSYTLHKVPGALAAYHECALLAGYSELPGTCITSIDIIKFANWL